MRSHLPQICEEKKGLSPPAGQTVNKNHKCCTVTQQTDDTSQRPNEHLQIIHALCFRLEIFFFLLLLSVTVEVAVKRGQTVERDEGAEEIKDRRDEQRLTEGERDDNKRKEKRER